MNTLNGLTLEALTNELNNRVELMGGAEVVMSHYDSVYSSMFRSEPMTIKAYLGGCEDGSQDELIAELKENYLDNLFRLDNKDFDFNPDLDCDYESDAHYDLLAGMFDCWLDANSGIVNNLVIDENTLICYLCNYKGEGEGEALYIEVKNLKVFKSKRESFNF